MRWPAVLLVVLLVPLAAADGVSSVHLVFDRAGEATAQSVLLAEGEDAAHMRRSMDADEDGRVEQDEVEAYERQYRAFLDEMGAGSEVVGASYALDGSAPWPRLKGLAIDAAGEVGSGGPVTVTIDMSYAWNVTPRDAHTLIVHVDGPGETEPPAEIMFEIVAPPGFRPKAAARDANVSDRLLTTTVVLQADQDFTVTFERNGNDVPGLGAVAVVAGAAAAALLRRAR